MCNIKKKMLFFNKETIIIILMPGRPKPKLLSNWLGIIILVLIHIRTHFIVPPISGLM
jgi:hypothetical protein